MMIDTDTFITGEPIQTAIGDCRFFTVREYKKVAYDLSTMSLTKDHIINLLSRENKDHETRKLIDYISNLSLYEITKAMPHIGESYDRIFKSAFFDGGHELINAGTFSKMRELILLMNCMKEEKINPNPEIQAALERSKRVKARDNGEELKFGDMVSSVVMFGGFTYQQINDFTIYQLHMSFRRIDRFNSYDADIIFRTIDHKRKVESWSKHINLFEEEKHYVTQDEFSRNTGSMFND